MDKFPCYLMSLEAFKAGETITSVSAREAGQHLSGLLQNESCTSKTEQVVACELIASSIGHPCRSTCWNVYVDLFLFSTKFVASEALVSISLTRARKMAEVENDPETENDLRSLIKRLRCPPVAFPHKSPILAKNAMRSLLKSFGNSDGDFALLGSDLVTRELRVSEAILISCLKPGSITSLDFGFDGEPKEENAQAVRILLHRFRDSIHSLRCDAWMQPGRHREVSSCTRIFWDGILEELRRVPLRIFESFELGISDEFASEIVEKQGLSVFRVARFSIPEELVEVGLRFVNAASRNHSLKVVNIANGSFWRGLGNQLKLERPEIILQNGPGLA